MRKKILDVSLLIFISTTFWIYPVLSLISTNLGQIQLNASFRLILVSIIVSIGLLFLAGKLLKSLEKGLLFSCFLSILFSTYGQIYFEIEKLSIGNFLIGRHRYLILLYIVLLIAGAYWIYRIKEIRQKHINFLIPVALLLLVMPSYPIVDYLARQSTASPATSKASQSSKSSANMQLPDIYLLILDGYGRSDLLKESFGDDNSNFLNFLSSKGFYIVRCSQANYTRTWYSIASMLNMNYLDAMPPINGETREVPWMVPYIKHSIVQSKLKAMGYRTVAFETGFGFSEMTDADIYLQPSDQNVLKVISGNVNAFELLYLRTTIFSAWMDLSGISTDEIENTIKLERENFIYSALQNDVPKMEGPKFVFAHILTTHYPFVYPDKSFDQDPVVSQFGSRTRGYHDSLVYSDKMMTPIIETILNSSKTPPVIIITGDHGPSIKLEAENAVQNIDAIFLGGQKTDLLYPTITPVNIFRVVFDTVFNEDYPLLPDQSFVMDFKHKKQLVRVENICAGQ